MARKVLASLRRLEHTPPGLEVALVFLGRMPPRGVVGLPLLAKLELSETARQVN